MLLALLTVLFTLMFLFVPDQAFAWGPATHMYYGLEILKDLSALSPLVASILARFPEDYLYGCISADITVGKKYTQYRNHCHNWRIGLRLLAEAETVAQKSFAFGYLSHLAADTVAHNFFVPSQIISAYSRRSLGHTYWEIRADSLVPRKYWRRIGKISEAVQESHDGLMENVVARTLFSFDVNKKIFKGILQMHRFKQWRGLVREIGSRSRWILGLQDIEKYHRLCKLAILDLLVSFKDAECMKLDPTGKANLNRARKIRRDLRRVARGRVLSTTDYRSVMKRLPVQAPLFYD
jgi:hypothetical protein